MAEGRLDDVDLSAGGAGEIVGITATVRAFLVQLRQARAQGTAAAAAQAARIAQQTAMDRHTQDFGASISGVMARLAASAGVLYQRPKVLTPGGIPMGAGM
jgi:methyl-accepting chemotaxis protein